MDEKVTLGQKISDVSSSAWGWITQSTYHMVGMGAAVAVGVTGAGYGVYHVASTGDAQPEVTIAEPEVDIQTSSGSSVITGGGERNLDLVEDAPMPEPSPAPIYVPEGEITPDDVPEPVREVPPEIVEPGNHAGQQYAPRFVPGEEADKVDTAPRPAAPRPVMVPANTDPNPGEGEIVTEVDGQPAIIPEPKAVDESLANTIEVLGSRYPMIPSGDNEGVFSPPENPALTGWYQDSAEAGTDEEGSVLVSSHVNMAGKTGVGTHFATLNPGDVVTVWNTDGQRTEWRVKEKFLSLKSDPVPEVVNRSDGPQELVLTSCGGGYIGGDVGYDSNVIVVAEPVHGD